MANNYSGYSFAIRVPNEEAAKWLEKEAKDLNIDTTRVLDSSVNDSSVNDSFNIKIRTRFQSEIILVFSKENSIDIYAIGFMLQMYLEKFAPQNVIGFSWATWADKPRINEFGGGVLIVTADGFVAENTEERLKKLMVSA